MKIIHGIILTVLLTLWSCSSREKVITPENTSEERADKLNKLLRYSVTLMDSSEYDMAFTLLDSLKSIAISEDNKTLLSGVLNNQGNYYYRLGDFRESIRLIEESLELDKEMVDSTSIGVKLKNIGISYKAQGDQQKALSSYIEALIILRPKGDSTEIASINNSIGNIYNSLHEYDRALGYLTEARAIWTAKNLPKKTVLAMGNLGNTYLGLNRLEEAIDIYQRTLKIKRSIGKKNSIAITLNNLGEAFLLLEEFSTAEMYFLESINLRKEANRQAGIALVSNNLAALELKRGNFAKTQQWLDRAKSILAEYPASDRELENLRLQKILLAETGNFKKAYETDLRYDNLRQTGFEQELRNVQKEQYDYDIDQEEKAKELAQSKFEASDIDRKAQKFKADVQGYVIIATLLIVAIVSYLALKLRKKNRHIENLMRELHHRVKNHLGMISGMFGAQSEQGTANNADLLEEAKTRVEAVNGIHRRLYRQDEYEYVNMQEYLTELVDNSALVFGLYQNIHKELKIDSEPLEIDKAISVGLIANEVLTNAFKYGLQKADEPTLKIVLEKAVKGYRMTIFNNAAPDQKPITESTGFGKELIKRLTTNLKGESRTIQQNGFQFELTFP